MSRPFRTAPMKDGIRYDDRGEPIGDVVILAIQRLPELGALPSQRNLVDRAAVLAILRAALADEQRDTLDAATLDVEMLAEAIANVPHGSSFHEQISGKHLLWPLLDERAQGHTRDFARKVAAQYAARLKGEKP